MFHDMIHKEMRVYSYDMIAKSISEDGRPNDLRNIFERLSKYKGKLNPRKCIFSTTSGELLCSEPRRNSE